LERLQLARHLLGDDAALVLELLQVGGGGRDRLALRDEVVAGVAGPDRHEVAGVTEMGHVLAEDHLDAAHDRLVPPGRAIVVVVAPAAPLAALVLVVAVGALLLLVRVLVALAALALGGARRLAGGALLGLAGLTLGGALVARLLELHRPRLARLDVLDLALLADREEAEDGLVDAQRALERRHRLARIQIEEREVVALLEALDLVGELALAHVVHLERDGAFALEQRAVARDQLLPR